MLDSEGNTLSDVVSSVSAGVCACRLRLCSWKHLNKNLWICGPTAVLSLLVVNHIIDSTLTLPFLVAEQRVAPSGETRVLQYYRILKSLLSEEMHLGNIVYVLHVSLHMSVICKITKCSK